jgi:hypothetical protein
LNDMSPVCGPDLEWDHCASPSARLTALVVLLVITCIATIAAYWGQKVIQAAVGLWFDSEPLGLFANRPRWSRTSRDPADLP